MEITVKCVFFVRNLLKCEILKFGFCATLFEWHDMSKISLKTLKEFSRIKIN